MGPGAVVLLAGLLGRLPRVAGRAGGRPRAAAKLAGYADTGYAASEDTRELNEATAYNRACTLARAAIGDVEFDRLHAEGQPLRDERIEAIAFATDDTA